MLFRKYMDLTIRSIFLDQEGKSVVQDVTGSEGHTFRLVVYASIGVGLPDFLRRLETFLGTCRSLVLVRNQNGELNTRQGCVGRSRLGRHGKKVQKLHKPSQTILTGIDLISLMYHCGPSQTASGHRVRIHIGYSLEKQIRIKQFVYNQNSRLHKSQISYLYI